MYKLGTKGVYSTSTSSLSAGNSKFELLWIAPFQFQSRREISILKSCKHMNGNLRKIGEFSFVIEWLGDLIGFNISKEGFKSHLQYLDDDTRAKMIDPDYSLFKPEYKKTLQFGSEVVKAQVISCVF